MSETHELFTRTVFMLALMVVTLMTANVMKMRGIHWVSETSLYVLIGLVVGLIFVSTTSATHKDDIYNRDIQLESSFFYMVLLPPIILEGGLTLQRVAFVRNLVMILMLALVGAMYSTLVTSLLMYLFTRLLSPEWSALNCLIFGSIISSTDPVSVLGMLPPTVDRNLYMLIFGESALNDAVSIILYRFFTNLLEQEQETKTSLSAGMFLWSMIVSIGIFFGSTFVGVATALIYAKLTKHVKPPEAPIFELLMFLVFAYMSYLIADLIGCTGIISVFFCGVAMAHYAYDNLSKITILSSRVVLRTMSSMCDCFIFLYLGLGLFAFGKNQTTYDVGLIFCAIISILISRTHVFWICGANNLVSNVTHKDRRVIPRSQQTFLWFCGLRGAVSFALGRETLDNPNIEEHIKAQVFGTVIVVVFSTVVGMGGLTPFMLRKLGIDGSAKESHHHEANDGHSVKSAPIDGKKRPSNGSLNTIDEYLPSDRKNEEQVAKEAAEFMEAMDNSIWMKFYELDRRFIKPYFSNTNKRSKKMGNAMYETTGVRIGDQNFSSSRGNVYEMKNTNLVHALDDDDESQDELDRIPISVAAEMFGIAGSTLASASVSQSSASLVPAPGVQPFGRSRSPSIASIKPVGRRLSVATIGGTRKIPPSSLSSSVALEESPVRKMPPVRMEPTMDEQQARASTASLQSNRIFKKKPGSISDDDEVDTSIPLDDDDISLVPK